jgi:hypothetical protein
MELLVVDVYARPKGRCSLSTALSASRFCRSTGFTVGSIR